MDKLYRLSFIIFVLAVIPILAGGNLNGVNIIKDGSGYIIEFNLPQYQSDLLQIDEEQYIALGVENYGVNRDFGLPALPLISFNLVIPETLSSVETEILIEQIEKINLDHKIFPFQAPWEKSRPASERPFTIDREYYNSIGNLGRELVEVSPTFIIGGLKGVTVTIHPFAYNPQEDLLKLTRTARFRVKIFGELESTEIYSMNMNSFFEDVFQNYEPTSNKQGMKYLIITAPEFEADLTPFIDHKTGKGFDVSVFNTTATGTTSGSIKTFIQQLYDNPSTKPEFVLFVGDVNKIPAFSGSGSGSPNTDWNYALLEGSDYYADVFIGRFSVANSAELGNVIDKTLYMENYIGTLDKKNCFMASTDNYSITEGTHNYVINNYFDPDGYFNLKLYTHTYNATTQQLINALNDNQQFAIYSGHGATTYWADGPQLSQEQVRALTNTVFPFVYSFACVTGSYQLSECFGETWIRTENGGSAFWGSSVNSFWDEDDVLEKKIFAAMFDEDLTKITPMFNKGKFDLVAHYGGNITPGGDVLRYLEMYNLMGDPSLGTKMQIPPDNTPPEPVVDLTAGDVTSNSVTLNWTAPYDSTFGGVTSYDIRYSLTPIITDDDFNNAPQIIFDGQSDTAGTPKSYNIEELDPATIYYFAVKAMDVWFNASVMSNVPIGTTFDPPVMSVDPLSLSCVVQPNTQHSDTIWIANVSAANSTLNYNVEMTNNTFPGDFSSRLIGVNSNGNTGVQDKNHPVESFGSALKGSGGPDPFGYEWIDSNEPNGPEYIWEDISSTGNLATQWIPTGSFSPADEGYAGPFNIGFDFKFYGNVKNNVYVSSNGFLAFSPVTENSYTNDPIPTSDYPNEIIAPFWDDLDGQSTGKVYYMQDGNRFIIQYDDWHKYSGTGTLTFQIVLHSNGKIIIYYENMTASLTSATIGVEDASGTVGLQVVNNAAYVQNGLALQIAAEPDWLSLNHHSGLLYNGNTAALVLDFNCDGLDLGDYSMDVVITGNDPTNSELTVPVQMTITNEVPVELISFDAEFVEGIVNLNWSTATETNNQGFQIESKSGSGQWESIGFIEGKGTTSEKSVYSFRHAINHGTFSRLYFRLKQIDFDGTFAYSEEVEVSVAPDKFELSQNYPNPFNPATKIKFSLPKNSRVKLSIYNAIGQKVAELLNKEMDLGYHEIDFYAGGLSSGIYYYRIEAGSFVSVKKMMILK